MLYLIRNVYKEREKLSISVMRKLLKITASYGAVTLWDSDC